MASLTRIVLAATAAAAASLGAAAGQTDRTANNGPALEPLGAQRLMPGQCGLFLWNRLAEQRGRDLIAIIGGSPTSIYVRVRGRLTRVPRHSVSGQPLGGQHPQQRFLGDTLDVAVRLPLEPPPSSADGPVVRGGVVTARSRQGWETITPVSGERRCEPSRPAAP